MIKIQYANKHTSEELLKRNVPESTTVDEAVKGILENVKSNGDKALFEYAEKFDRAKLKVLQVSAEEIAKAVDDTDEYFKDTLMMAKANIEEYHRKQLKQGYEIKKENGVVLGQRILPLEKVGIYVPGGTASYPSTVLMNAIPAKIANVKEVIMVTPPNSDGIIAKEILTAAYIAGVDKIFKIGGAGAVAALAYGTESVPKVDKIVGPGNVFVATAKRMVFGTVDIDMVAGPSEVLVVADDSANPVYVAADLLSQAEHDKLSSSFLITDSESLAKAVSDELERQIPLLERAEIARTSIDNNGKIIVASDIDEALDYANEFAPEHLELAVEDPFSLLPKVINAGSVFLGHHTPEPMGDYFAGPNHTLPTSGTARFSSPLGVDDFIKRTSYLHYTEEALCLVSERVADFARREGLTAHAKSITVRGK
ncbi:MAG: histidinol dehydrogenase [Ruminococcaceae bacterium]|nr:histidinol dehydrogenase [Oscillospiraceae bacterium]